MDEDDLPPPKGHRTESAGASFGRGAGALVWIALFFVVAGALAYAAIEWLG